MKQIYRSIAYALWLILSLPLAIAQQAPEIATGYTLKEPAYGKRYMVVAAHPLAVDAGIQMLKRGGNAIDAAIATSLVLNLVEPQSSGIGGGGFLLYLDERNKSLIAFDGRETAPEAATADLFLDSNGNPLSFLDAVVGGKSVGVPGLLRMFEVAHARYGKLEWRTLFGPAIRLAEKGFPLSQRTARQLKAEAARLKNDAAAAAYFFHADGTPLETGEIVRNPQFAATLRQIALEGADAFYMGSIAQDIVATVQKHPHKPGKLDMDDLRRYRVRKREAVCGTYRVYRLCGMPPPSSGGLSVLELLGILQHFDMAALTPASVEAIHLFSEAGRLAFADRDAFIADPDYMDVPTTSLLNPEYLRTRSQLIDTKKSLGHAEPGRLAGERQAVIGEALELPATSHLSIVDTDGNAVSLTQSIDYSFGSHLMVRGFMLNNQLTDFSFKPVVDGIPVANRVQPGKRPRSAMAPLLIFDEKNHLLGALGSAGGSAIINHVAKTAVGVIDWRLDLQHAIDLANFGSRNGPTELEKERGLESLVVPLEAQGHAVKLIEMNSGVHGFWRTSRGWMGAADPRREGTARGE